MKKPISIPISALWLGCLLSINLTANTLEGMPGTPFSPSAQPMGHLGLAISMSALGHQGDGMIKEGLFYFQGAGIGGPDSSLNQDILSATARVNLALGLGKFIDLGLSIPYSTDLIDDRSNQDISGSGFGDPGLFAKAGFPVLGDYILSAALFGNLTVPSKSEAGFLPKQPGYMSTDSTAGDRHFFSSHGIGGSLQTLLTLDLTRLETHPPFRANLNVGGGHSGAVGSAPQFLFGAGMEWLPLPALGFVGSIQSSTRLSEIKKFVDIGKEYAYAAIGFTATGEEGIFFSATLQKSLSQRPFRTYSKPIATGIKSYETRFQPTVALAITIGWSGQLVAEDTDHDGIPNQEDLCITEAEDKDNFQDLDGCPEIDNDGDSTYDAVDKCPNEPEDRDGFKDEDGCAELDNDQDGLPDLQDKCRNEPEDPDGFEDFDGCPDLDNDRDGLLDIHDKCPVHAEDRDGFEDSDGCPDLDNDQDKIPDLNDKCPGEVENFNGFEDGDGCPDLVHGSSGAPAKALEMRIQLRHVRFKETTAELLPESYPSLDSISIQINSVPGAMVEVRGYVDGNMGELEGMRLSEARAIAVRNYILGRGVSGNQILARGMGARDPIATNRTAAGRAQNRRIELHRLDK
jgi:outer membrane protein OmpA-like peptidoglycan-associated protein